MQQGKMVVTQKGRQRIRPRRKKFSALKKKVLEERLRQWRQKNQDSDKHSRQEKAFTTLAVLGWLTADDDCNDNDEYQELCENFQEMAEKIGKVQRLWLPRQEKSPVYVQFQTTQSAEEARHAWNGLSVGGADLQVMALLPLDDDKSRMLSETEDDWRIGCERVFQEKQTSLMQSDTLHEIGLWNALTEDDLEDDECLAESVNDIRLLATSYGPLETLRVEKEEASPRVVLVYTCNLHDAKRIAVQLNQVTLSGNPLSAKVLRDNESPSPLHGDDFVVVLRNVLTTEDLEDEDSLEESMGDIEELGKQFGVVEKVDANIEEQTIFVHYTSAEEKQKALTGFHGMVIGGQTVSVTAVSGSDGSVLESSRSKNNDAIEPMFSGDKRIPERFAECKRVPKVPNSGQPRHYAILSENETVKPLLMEMLAELMRLQKRAAEDKNAKAKRRLVMGLREVARGIRARKVRMVVMANNLDEYGALDEKLQEILDLAQKEEVPVFFEFSKRTLGKAIGKTIKMAVIGIQNPDGANQQFKKLSGLAAPIPVREP
jgi:selenocysteine insertion sequence-binding protein 2